MPFRRGGGGKRRDLAESPILQAVRAVGAEAWQISGTGLPDVLIRFRGRVFVGEIKSVGGVETVHQGAFPIWRTPDQVLRVIGAIASVNPRGHQSLDPPGRSKRVDLTMTHAMFAAIRHRMLVNRLGTIQDQIRDDIAAADVVFDLLHPK